MKSFQPVLCMDMKSRMKREFHVRFCEKPRVWVFLPSAYSTPHGLQNCFICRISADLQGGYRFRVCYEFSLRLPVCYIQHGNV